MTSQEAVHGAYAHKSGLDLLARLHAYHLVAKIPRSRRWKVSTLGYRMLGASLRLRDHVFPEQHAAVVAEQHITVAAAAA